jgi:hypothetical protein
MFIKKILTINFEKIILIAFLLYLYQLPLNIYSIYLHNYNQRLLNNYGYCEKESYGYLEKINKNTNNKNIYSYNFGDFSRSSSVFFFKLTNKFDDNKVAILNYYSNNIENDKKIIDIFGKFKVLDNYQNRCFLIETEKSVNAIMEISGKMPSKLNNND